MKRVFSIFLILALSISWFGVLAEENIQTVSDISAEIKFLKTLKIPNIELVMKEKLTREEFTALIVSAFYPEINFSYSELDEVFSDVSEKNDYANYIKAAKDLNIINGGADSKFRPTDIITVNDAIVITVNALGYTLYANAQGGYPTGFLTLAKIIGILKNVAIENELTGITASKIIYNSLFVDEVSLSSISNDSIEITTLPFANLLSSTYKIYKYDVNVVSNFLTSLDGGNPANIDTVTLKSVKDGSKMTVYSGNSGIEKEIGKRLVCYVRNNVDTGKNEVVHYKLHNNVKIISVSADNILNIQSSYIEYEEGSKIIKINTSKSPYVLYNGVLLNVYNANTLKPEDGVLTFIDNDGDNACDVISILSFTFNGNKDSYGYIIHNENSFPARNIIVDRVDLENEFITCKWNPRNNVKLDKDSSFYTLISKDDSKLTLSDIESGDILSVALSPETVDGKPHYYLALSKTKINDILASYGSDNSVTIGDDDYKVSSSIYKVRTNYIHSLKTGKDISASLNYSGKIAYMGNLQGSVNNYAYLINAAKRTDGEEYVIIKVLEKSGSINEYKLSSSVKIDGVSYKGKSAQEQYNALIKRPDNYQKWIKNENDSDNPNDDEYYETNISRPLILKINSDNIVTMVDTDNPNYAINNSELPNVYSTANKIGYSNEEVFDSETLKAGYRSPRIIGYKTAGATVEGKFFITSDTYVFKVPDIDTCGFNDYAKYLANPSNNTLPDYKVVKMFELEKDEENYQVISSGDLIDGRAYDVQGYNIDPDTGVAELVVLRGRDAIRADSDYSSAICVYLRRTKYYDEKNEKYVEKIYYTQDGVKEESAILDMESMLFVYDYVMNGRNANDTDNIYGIDIPAIKEGDLIRVSVSGGYISHIERVLILDNIDNTYSSINHPTTSDGYRSTGNKERRLCDVYNYWSGNSSTINIFITTPNQIKGNILSSYMGLQYPKNINLQDPTSYTEQFIDISGVKPLLITIKADGTVKTDQGSVSDIKTIRDQGGLSGTSTVIYRHARFKINQLIIINDER